MGEGRENVLKTILKTVKMSQSESWWVKDRVMGYGGRERKCLENIVKVRENVLKTLSRWFMYFHENEVGQWQSD